MWKGWIYLLAPIFSLLISIKEAFRDILKSFQLSCLLPSFSSSFVASPNGWKQDPGSLEEMCSGQSRLEWSWPRTLDPAFRTATQTVASKRVGSCMFTVLRTPLAVVSPRRRCSHLDAILVRVFSHMFLRVWLERRWKLGCWEQVRQPRKQKRQSGVLSAKLRKQVVF